MGLFLPSFKRTVNCAKTSDQVTDLLKKNIDTGISTGNKKNILSGTVNAGKKRFSLRETSVKNKFYRSYAYGEISDTEKGCSVSLDFYLKKDCYAFQIIAYAFFAIALLLTVVSAIVDKTNFDYGFIAILSLAFLLSQGILRTRFNSSAELIMKELKGILDIKE